MGESRQQLYRVTGALRLSTGAIAVANAGTGEIRIYDSLGVWIRSLGRLGDGPGEFRNLWILRQQGSGRLIAYDLTYRRLTYFDDDLAVTRSVTLQAPPVGYVPMPVAVTADGSAIVKPLSTRDPTGHSGTYRNMIQYHLYSARGEALRTIATLPGPEGVVVEMPRVGSGCGGPIPYPGPCLRWGAAIFARGAPVASNGEHLFYSDTEAFEVLVLQLDGTITRLMRMAVPIRQVTADDRMAQLAERLGRRRYQERHEPHWPVPPTFPAIGSLHIDLLGKLWVQHYVGPLDTEQRWTVFDPSGVVVGELSLPASLEIYDIGSDWLLGGWRGDFDVQYVRLYRLVRLESNST